jgi:hypothetical protein
MEREPEWFDVSTVILLEDKPLIKELHAKDFPPNHYQEIFKSNTLSETDTNYSSLAKRSGQDIQQSLSVDKTCSISWLRFTKQQLYDMPYTYDFNPVNI